MHTADDSPDGVVHSPADQFRHDLKSPLTTVHGRAYLLSRSIRRSPSLADEERARMLEGLAAIEGAVQQMVIVIDGMGSDAAKNEAREP